MSKLFTLIVVAVIIPLQLSGDISGRTYSTNNQPLPFVAIIHQATGQWCISDENGNFYLHCNTAQGDTISVSRFGYLKKQIVLTESAYYTIHLQSDNIQLADIIVEGKTNPLEEATATVTRSAANRLSTHNWMKEIPGLSIRSYGSAASNLTITLNGGSAVHTKVLLEGVDLTNPIVGQSDISQIPLLLVNKITVDNSAGILHGSGAIDGSVNLKVKPTGSYISYAAGSFGYQSFDFNWKKHRKNYSFDIGAGTFSEEGNFDSTWRDQVITRENNAMQQKYIFTRLESMLQQKYVVNAYYLNTWQDRELAGQIYSPTPDATSEDELRLVALNLISATSFGYVRGRINHRYNSLYYYNPWTTPQNSDHFTESNQIQVDSRLRFGRYWEIFINTEIALDRINSTDAGEHDRTTYATALGFNYQPLEWLSLAPAVRYDHSLDLYGETTYDLSLLIQPFKSMSVIYSGGTAFRYPTFSDMYWTYVGNPDLEAEHTSRHSLTLKYNPLPNYYFALLINDTNSKNLIKWQPGNPYWRPVNLAKVHRTAVSLQAKTIIGSWYVSSNYTFVSAMNLATDRAVRYSPKHSGNASLNYLGEHIKTGLQLRFTGKQIYIYDYPEDKYIEPYAILSFSLHCKWEFLSHNLSFDALIDNLLDTDYMNVYGYPEPGINFRLALTYDFN